MPSAPDSTRLRELIDDCPYGPGGFLIDEIVTVDSDASLVRARMPTSADLPLTREQRADPLRHPSHVSGGLMVHMTGMIAYVHSYLVLGLRHADGWVGYGAKMYGARFRALAPPGEPLVLECRATQVRKGDTSVFARYDFRFLQGETLVYDGDQAAYWTNVLLTKAKVGLSNG